MTKKKQPKAKPAAKSTPTPRPRAKQGEIAGTRKTIQEIEEAAEDHVGNRDNRMEYGVLEKKSGEKLIALLKKHQLNAYRMSDGRLVEIVDETVQKVKVRTEKPEKGADAA